MKVSALTGKSNYFEDFTVGDVMKHARGKTVEPMEQVWITNVTMNTAEAHFNEHLTKSTNYGQRLGFGGVTIWFSTSPIVVPRACRMRSPARKSSK